MGIIDNVLVIMGIIDNVLVIMGIIENVLVIIIMIRMFFNLETATIPRVMASKYQPFSTPLFFISFSSSCFSPWVCWLGDWESC